MDVLKYRFIYYEIDLSRSVPLYIWRRVQLYADGPGTQQSPWSHTESHSPVSLAQGGKVVDLLPFRQILECQSLVELYFQVFAFFYI